MTQLLLTKCVSFGTSEKTFSSKIPSNYSTLSRLETSQKSATWFHDLPMAVLIKIFCYFSEEELRKNILPVCQKWRYAALRPELWKNLKVSGKKISTNQVYYDISRFTGLQCVVLNNVKEPRQIIRQICRCLPNLKDLTVKNCEEIPEKTLTNVFFSCKQLEKLNLSGTAFRGNKIYENLPLLCNLKSLNFSKNPYMTIKNLTTCVLNCYNLEEFRLSKWISQDEPSKFDDEDISSILLNLASNLKSITLDCSNLTTKSFNKILTCKGLERLCLYRSKHLDGDMLEKFYQYFPNLKILKIKHASRISDSHVIKLFTNGEAVMKNVHVLDLTGCWQVTDKGLNNIVNCCRNLKNLSLQGCKSLTSVTPIKNSLISLNFLNIAFDVNMDIQGIETLKLNKLVIDENQEKFVRKNVEGVEVWVSLSEYKKTLRKIVM